MSTLHHSLCNTGCINARVVGAHKKHPHKVTMLFGSCDKVKLIATRKHSFNGNALPLFKQRLTQILRIVCRLFNS